MATTRQYLKSLWGEVGISIGGKRGKGERRNRVRAAERGNHGLGRSAQSTRPDASGHGGVKNSENVGIEDGPERASPENADRDRRSPAPATSGKPGGNYEDRCRPASIRHAGGSDWRLSSGNC